MKKLTLAMMVAMAFLSFGCKKKGSDAGNAMAKMSEFADEMCKCKDAKCAQEVSDKMTKWGQEQSKNAKEPPKMNEAAQEIGKRMGECMTKAMGAGGAMGGGTPEGGSAAPVEGGSAAPAAEGSAAAGSAAPAAEGSAAGSAAK
jgi:hypothetical protein